MDWRAAGHRRRLLHPLLCHQGGCTGVHPARFRFCFSCRRVNALEHVVKPKLENTIAYIKVGSRRSIGGCATAVLSPPGRLSCGSACSYCRVAHCHRHSIFGSPQGELDELEREEFFRLKKVQGNKKKHAEAAAAKEAEVGGRVGGFCGGPMAWAAVGDGQAAHIARVGSSTAPPPTAQHVAAVAVHSSN